MEKSAIHIKRTGISGREYIVCCDKSKPEGMYLIKEERRMGEQKDVWHTEIYEIKPDGTSGITPSFGGDSYYRADKQGGHMLIGSVDMSYLLGAGSEKAVLFGAWLAVALGLEGTVGVVFARALTALFPIGKNIHTNPDDSLNIFIDNLNIALISKNVAMHGLQPVRICLGTSNKVVML